MHPVNVTPFVRSESMFTATTTEAPELGFFDRMLETIGMRSLEDEDRMIGKNIFFCMNRHR